MNIQVRTQFKSMKKFKFAKLLILGISFFCTNSFGADIIYMRGNPDRLNEKTNVIREIPDNWLPRIVIDGEIRPGDDILFHGALNRAKEDSAYWKTYRTVLLNSNGGDVATAMKIGRVIRNSQLITAVHEKNICASACILILSGGVWRYTRDGAMLGLHRPYFANQAKSGTSAFDKFQNAYDQIIEMHRRYFSEMRIDIRLLQEMMQIPSNEIKWISNTKAEEYALLGEDPIYAEWKRANRIATKGASCVAWEDKYFSYCFERAISEQESTEECEKRTNKPQQCK